MAVMLYGGIHSSVFLFFLFYQSLSLRQCANTVVVNPCSVSRCNKQIIAILITCRHFKKRSLLLGSLVITKYCYINSVPWRQLNVGIQPASRHRSCQICANVERLQTMNLNYPHSLKENNTLSEFMRAKSLNKLVKNDFGILSRCPSKAQNGPTQSNPTTHRFVSSSK